MRNVFVQLQQDLPLRRNHEIFSQCVFLNILAWEVQKLVGLSESFLVAALFLSLCK